MRWLDGITNSQGLLKLISVKSATPSDQLILCHTCLLLPSIISQSIMTFPMSQFFAPGSQSIRASALASVLPMNIQDRFPLGWTGLISLQSKGLSRSSPTPQFKNFNSLALSFLYGPTLTYKCDHYAK